MKKSGWVIVLLLVAAFQLAAQPFFSRDGKFQVDAIRGCAPLTVNVTILVPSQCIPGFPCGIDFDHPETTSPVFAVPTPYTYNTPGTYTLQVLFNGGGGSDEIRITVDANVAPTFETYGCIGGEVNVNVTDRNFQQYQIEYVNKGTQELVDALDSFRDRELLAPGGETIRVRGRNVNAINNCQASSANYVVPSFTAGITRLEVTSPTEIRLNYTTENFVQYRLEVSTNTNPAFQTLKTVYNSTSDMITTLRPDDNFYCFRLAVFDPCSNRVIRYSNTICSSNFDVTAENNFNNLTWATRNTGSPTFSVSKTPGIPFTAASSPFRDSFVTCGTEYCYRLTMQYSGGIQSISMQKCATAFSTDTPPALQNVSTNVTNPGVKLDWRPAATPVDEYLIFKNTNEIGRSATNSFTDPTYDSPSGACFTLSYTDRCDNLSTPSRNICPIQLTGRVTSDNTIVLDWSRYEGWTAGVGLYDVQKYSPEGTLLETISAGTSLTITDDDDDPTYQRLRYVVIAYAIDGTNVPSSSNEIWITKRSNIHYPTAFTPNGDGLNDSFRVYGQFVDAFEINIFNRWGELIFNGTSLEQGWDGTFNGNPMPESMYTFIAEIRDKSGRTFKESGSFLLMRKK